MGKSKKAPRRDETEATRITTEISENEFTDFKSFLKIIKMNFNDLSIVDGAFRAYSNDRAIMVETGFPFFRGMSFYLADIRSILKSVSTYGRKSPITATLNDSAIIIEDQSGGALEFELKPPDYLDNKFISDEEMMDSWVNKMDPDKLIISGAIPEVAVVRLKRALRTKSADGIFFKHDENDLSRGALEIQWKPAKSDKKGAPYEFQAELRRPFIARLGGSHNFKFDRQSMLFSNDDLYLTCYSSDEIILSVFNTKVGDFFVNIYTKSAPAENGEEG